jgi:hypothetical protein
MEEHEHHFLKLAGKILGTMTMISLIVLLAGYFLHWSDPVQYSNGFFGAGAILIVVGAYSNFSGSLNADTSYTRLGGQTNAGERSLRLGAEMTQRHGTMIFLFVTGLLLILIAVGLGQFFISA